MWGAGWRISPQHLMPVNEQPAKCRPEGRGLLFCDELGYARGPKGWTCTNNTLVYIPVPLLLGYPRWRARNYFTHRAGVRRGSPEADVKSGGAASSCSTADSNGASVTHYDGAFTQRRAFGPEGPTGYLSQLSP